MSEVFPFVKNQQMIADAEKLRLFMTDARGCGLEALTTTPASEIAAEMAAKYPAQYTAAAGLEGLGVLLKTLDADITAPMTPQELTDAQHIESGLEARENATLIRNHVAAMRAGVESFEEHPDHIALVERISETYPDVLKGTGLEALETFANGLEGMADIIEKAKSEGTNGAIDWGAVFNVANDIASTISWRAFSPKGLMQNRTLSKSVATLLTYGEQERFQATSSVYGLPNISKNRGMVFDKYVMVGQCMRGVVAVMTFTVRSVARFNIMEVDEIYLVSEFRTEENLTEMRNFIRTVARANGYNAANVTIASGLPYQVELFKDDAYKPVKTIFATTFL